MFFFEKVVLLGVKEFFGLHDDLNIIWKKLTPDRYPVPNKCQPKQWRHCYWIFERVLAIFGVFCGKLDENKIKNLATYKCNPGVLWLNLIFFPCRKILSGTLKPKRRWYSFSPVLLSIWWEETPSGRWWKLNILTFTINSTPVKNTILQVILQLGPSKRILLKRANSRKIRNY